MSPAQQPGIPGALRLTALPCCALPVSPSSPSSSRPPSTRAVCFPPTHLPIQRPTHPPTHHPTTPLSLLSPPLLRRFYSVVSLGREVCGFPRVVHGGLTAAIIDESFGGLLFSLKQAGALPFWGPAYTVQLEVSYKSKIAAGKTVLCTTEVESAEGRKLWMKAVVRWGAAGSRRTGRPARGVWLGSWGRG